MRVDPATWLRGATADDFAPDGQAKPSLWSGSENKDLKRYEISIWEHRQYLTDEDKERLIAEHLQRTVAFGEIADEQLVGPVLEYPEDGEPVAKTVGDRTYRVRVDQDNSPPGHANAVIESDDQAAAYPPKSVRDTARAMLLSRTPIIYRRRPNQA